MGGLFVFFYVLFFVFTSCCTKNHFENYLVSEIFTEKDLTEAKEAENDIEAIDFQQAWHSKKRIDISQNFYNEILDAD